MNGANFCPGECPSSGTETYASPLLANWNSIDALGFRDVAVAEDGHAPLLLNFVGHLF